VSWVLEEVQTVMLWPTFDGSAEKGKHVRLSEGRTGSPGGKKMLCCTEVLVELVEHRVGKVCVKAVNKQCVESLHNRVEEGVLIKAFRPGGGMTQLLEEGEWVQAVPQLS
jgi:hypothetical protein